MKYSAGNYDLYVGFEPWDISIRTHGELSGIQWHPNIAYFVPVSDDIVQPYAQFDDIRIYVQENSDDRKKTLKAVDAATGYGIYPDKLAYALDDLETLSIKYNGTDKVAMQVGRRYFVVLDFSGRLYYNKDALVMTPYLNYYPESSESELTGEIRWIDENILQADSGKGTFLFTMNDYASIEIHDDGTVSSP